MPSNPFSHSHTEEAPPPSYQVANSQHAPQDQSGHLAAPGSSADVTHGGPALGRTRSNSAGSLTASSGEDDGERGLSVEERVDMEDSFRELPDGWRREFDPVSSPTSSTLFEFSLSLEFCEIFLFGTRRN